jgi:hypothetical protein
LLGFLFFFQIPEQSIKRLLKHIMVFSVGEIANMPGILDELCPSVINIKNGIIYPYLPMVL